MKNLTKKVVDFAKKKKQFTGDDFDLIKSFIETFYLENKPVDFIDYSVEDMYDVAVSAFNFFSSRKSNELKVRVFNPDCKNGEFESEHTFVDIVTEDMPFLVDSLVGYIDRHSLNIKTIVHPSYFVSRSKSGKLEAISSSGKSSKQETLIQLHLTKITSSSEIKKMEEEIIKILETVSLVVKDWSSMVSLLEKAQEQIDNAKGIINGSNDITEIKDFISWIVDKNFIILGAQEFDITEVRKSEYHLKEVAGSDLGIFRSKYEDFRPIVMNSSFNEVGDSVENPYFIEILKSRYRSKIHRVTNAERIRIQKISKDGKVIGEFRFVGLFTSAAYHQNVFSIPLVRDKVKKVIFDAGYAEGSHNHKDLVSVLESYPRDEIFQITPEDLYRISTGIVSICGRSQIRFFARADKFGRFVSCFIFTPRDHTNSDIRDNIRNYLAEVYNGEFADSSIYITGSGLLRFHVIIRTGNGVPEVDESLVEKEVAKIARVWKDDLLEAVREQFGDEQYLSFYNKYKDSFSVSYTNRFDPENAAVDIVGIEECLTQDTVLFDLSQPSNPDLEEFINLKIFSPKEEIILSSIMPLLEGFGFNIIQEQIYIVTIDNEDSSKLKKKVWIHYFRLNLSKLGVQFSETIKNNFEETVSLIWQGVTKTGFLNSLVISAGLNWKQVYMFRAYTKYMYQAGFRHNQTYFADVLARHSNITKLLVELFETKFDPSIKIALEDRKKRVKKISDNILNSLNKINDVNDDEAIRSFLGVIDATLRTNYYQLSTEDLFKGYMSFKFDCSKVPHIPLPLPYAEIFVYSPRVEAVHLRGGKVARGGLRWSDRQEDFRTEILGLMKAQMTKNAVIVPVGSKGGFVVKSDTTGLSREEFQKEGVECYKTFLRGLLDITDNVVNGKVIHPKDVVIYDGSDPYLVVAADKGTATFSDIANDISVEYNFWLDDAFASGGSVGYDHKKMGITAKGAWVSVMRHFSEMDIDTQSQDFTCVGIGDMAGDVFGNGMLLSKHIRLVAAFNHMHIFFDPNPDSAKSFKERQRMFDLPRSSWMDYDQSLISKGGGIFERSAKSITLSSEIKEVLGITEDELSPNDLIQAILKSPVDLLWNGGIGTYVKASDESNQDPGDRANDVVRINGNELRCKVVGEGGNLGLTQKGRIEYALSGGKINTDAMDNSAGVDCSDHEVNIKIALASALVNKKVEVKERNKVLESMTDEVSDLVLLDNKLQTQIISVISFLGSTILGEQSQFLDTLEKSGLLNREIEFLPSKKEIKKRHASKIGLTRPELCVMMSYSKMEIYNALISSDLVKDSYFDQDLLSYFPKDMQDRFSDETLNHQLRDEIIATQITNLVVNRGGITFVNHLSQDTGFGIVEIVKSFIIACDSFRLRDLWEEIDKLDGKIAHHIRMQMLLASHKVIERSILWLLHNKSKGNIKAIVTRFRKISDDLSSVLSDVLAKASKESFERKVERYRLNNVGDSLSVKVAALDPTASAFDIAEISADSNFDIKTIARVYFEIGTRLSLKWLRGKVLNMPFEDYWQKISSKSLVEDLYLCQMQIARSVVDFSCNNKDFCELVSIDKWAQSRKLLIDRFNDFISELKLQSNLDLSVFVVALNRLKPLIEN